MLTYGGKRGDGVINLRLFLPMLTVGSSSAGFN